VLRRRFEVESHGFSFKDALTRMTNGGRRIATATGAMLADPACLGNLPQDAVESLFDPEFWRSRGELLEVKGGRGAAWFIAAGERQWALRHFRRGGFIARLSRDLYVWAGEQKVRAFAEWRLLELLTQRGLPVPMPVAARYQRSGMFYRCDLITRRIGAAEPLSAALACGSLPEWQWRAIGAVIARLHAAGVDHADLNAHNILLDGAGAVSVIDFDRGRLRAPGPRRGAWPAGNLNRLRRSLLKISQGLPGGRITTQAWHWLLAGYSAERQGPAEHAGE
jgi:3-deoxy-D-manno-octulosonic acid kinase